MADVLSTGLSSLRALQRALDTTSHNIANVSTEGYTRQRVEFHSRSPQLSGGGWIGTGVEVSTVRRVYDQFLPADPQQRHQSRAARRFRLAGRTHRQPVRRLRPTACRARCRVSPTRSTKFPRRRHRFRRARCSSPKAARSPIASRVTTRACATCRPRSTAGSASKRRKSPRLRRASRRLNGDISVAVQQSGQPPNDLLDQRDALIDELSGKVGVSVVAEGDATLNVFIGNGQPLVLGTQASQITTQVDPLDPERTLLSHAHARGHRGPVARGVRRNARRTARLAQPDARSGAQRARPHRRRHHDAGERTASRGHGPHGRARRQLLQHRRGDGDAGDGQHRHGGGYGHAHQSRRAHGQRLRSFAHRHGIHAEPPGYGRGRQLHGHGHRRGSDPRRRPVHRGGRGHRDRRSLLDSARRAMRSRA